MQDFLSDWDFTVLVLKEMEKGLWRLVGNLRLPFFGYLECSSKVGIMQNRHRSII